MMKTNILTLCDFAKDYNGQLCISGTFNQIRSAVFPTEPVSFYIVMQFVISGNIEGDHFVSVTVVNKETGQDFLNPQDFKLNIAKGQGEVPDRDLTTSLILALDKVAFEAPGSYSIKVVSDGNVQDLNFYVVKI